MVIIYIVMADSYNNNCISIFKQEKNLYLI